ncbi:MAG: UDP-N-acetylmuramate--L-alanine ligase [Eubacteriales bacterium]|nr:UDP-N-acetylmuramate--L-alanine ligase [Eubacteriales bacterium]MDD3881541.1 UDP-N-acetylmuramate--L-alanine ligase [Eubacteriales bacterium]MDD4513389.1 UDP-N-acetylmuramate--L-alanine ligase [Eubacteriales bacterium]
MSVPHIRDIEGKHIHMVGIGGSSMSGLAEMLHDKGYIVSGSDRTDGYLIGKLRDMGMKITIGHKPENVVGAQLVVYTAAILTSDRTELDEAERLHIPTMERAVLLGQLMEGHKNAIGVCGAHGKTSTTGMISQMLMETGFDPSIHIGGSLPSINGSTRVGRSETFVAEACEFHRSFLQMRPSIIVMLNIDADHLDCFKDIDEIQSVFGEFLSLLPPKGLAIGNGDDARICELFSKLNVKRVTFGLNPKCDYRPANLTYDDEGHGSYDLTYRGETLCRVLLRVAGNFHVLNSMAALAVMHQMGADMQSAAVSLSSFTGMKRRFELTSITDGVRVFHDYGHNPTEMRAAISVAKKQKHNTLWAVMQPHTFSRVKALFNDYLDCTEDADITLVTDICAARETDPGDINSDMLVDGMLSHGHKAIRTPSFDDTERYLRKHWQSGDLVLTMGCGDINLLNEQIKKHGDTEK